MGPQLLGWQLPTPAAPPARPAGWVSVPRGTPWTVPKGRASACGQAGWCWRGSCAAAAPGSGPHCAHLPSCSPRLLQMPNPPAGWAAAPAPSSSLLGQWDRAPLHLNSILSRGRVRRGGSLCRRSSEWGRTRPNPGREAEESRSPGRMALKLIYDPLRGTARSQVGNSTFPAPRGAPCTAQRPLWPSTASPAVCGLGTLSPFRSASQHSWRAPQERWGWVPSEPPSGQASAAQGHRAGRRAGQLPKNALSQPGTQLREGQSLDGWPRATDGGG